MCVWSVEKNHSREKLDKVENLICQQKMKNRQRSSTKNSKSETFPNTRVLETAKRSRLSADPFLES